MTPELMGEPPSTPPGVTRPSESFLSPELIRGLRWRFWLSRSISVAALLLVLTVVDLFASEAAAAGGVLRLSVASSLPLNGSLPRMVLLEQLEARSYPPGLHLRLEAVAAGFWLGFPLWRGVLEAEPAAAPGTYQLEVLLHPLQSAAATPSVQMRPSAPERVLAQTVELLEAPRWRSEHPSWLTRVVGVAPGLGVFTLAMLLVGQLAGLFWWAHGLRLTLEAQGLCEVERLSRTESGWTLWFRRLPGPLLEPGIALVLVGRHGLSVGEARLEAVTEQHWILSLPAVVSPSSEMWVWVDLSKSEPLPERSPPATS